MTDDTAFLGAALAGLVSFFSPCVFPLLPLYLSIIVPEKEKSGKLEVMAAALSFVAGFTLVFILMGLTASAIGAMLMKYQDILRKAGGIFMVLMGLFQTGVFSSVLLLQEWRPLLGKTENKGVLGSFFLGTAFVFGWIPCTGPVLSSILMYAGMKQSVYHGAYLLTAYSVGFSIPLICLALFTDSMGKRFKDTVMPYLDKLHKIAGVVLILIGIALYFDYLSILLSRLL